MKASFELAVVVFCVLAAVTGTHLYPKTKRVVLLRKNETEASFRHIFKPRIINGQPASPGQFPHQAAVTIGTAQGTFLCGGSLVADQWILTAARCVVDVLSANVLLGSILLDGDSNAVTIPAIQAVYHGDYDPATGANDVALLKLSEIVQQNSYIRAISLNLANIGAGAVLLVSGFGQTSDDGGLNPALLYTTVRSLANSECNTYYPEGVPAGDLCAQGSTGESICGGDNGGALIFRNQGSDSQVGIVSYVSSAGCQANIPAVYTRVADQYNWIQQVVSAENP